MSDKVRIHTSKDLAVVEHYKPIGHAYQLMADLMVRHLPVVDSMGTIVGMLSDRDVQRAMEPDRVTFTSDLKAEPTFSTFSRVQDFMSWPIITISETAPISEAARLMVEKRISSLIVTREKTAVGVITTEDLLRTMIAEHEGLLNQFKDRIASSFYNSPIGAMAQTLASVGI